MNMDFQARAQPIRLLVVDVDGVLTDGSIFMDNEGQEYKAFNVRDGHGLKLLQRAGLMVAIITGRSSGVVAHRARELGIAHVFQGIQDKRLAYAELKLATGLADHQIAYMGDDVVDLPVMVRVGLAAAPGDAHPLVQAQSHYVARQPGGRGAVRELCELLLQSQGHWEAIVAAYLDREMA